MSWPLKPKNRCPERYPGINPEISYFVQVLYTELSFQPESSIGGLKRSRTSRRESKMNTAQLCVGLFGTCGGSQWRDPFMDRYTELGIEFFNPQVEDWKPEDAEIEADHLADDAIILFPITGETYGTGSLAETGFSALQAIKLNRHRDFVVMIERELDPSLDDPIARKESLRSRALVRKHLEKLDLASLYVVDSLDDMLELSVELHQIAVLRQRANRFRK